MSLPGETMSTWRLAMRAGVEPTPDWQHSLCEVPILFDKILSTPRVLRKDHGHCADKLIKTSGNLSLVHVYDPSSTRFATKCCKLSSSKKEAHFSFPLRSKKLLKNVELKTSPPDIRVFQRKSACSFSNNYSKQKFLCKI